MTKNKKIAIALALTLVAGYSIGRYATPTRVEIKKETVTVEKKVIDTEAIKRIELERDKTLRKVITEITRPDGTKEKVTRFVEHTTTNKTADTKTSKHEDTEKESRVTESKVVENKRQTWSFSAFAGSNVTTFSFSDKLLYGGHIQKNILGPFGLGVWGLTNRTGGLSLGVSF